MFNSKNRNLSVRFARLLSDISFRVSIKASGHLVVARKSSPARLTRYPSIRIPGFGALIVSAALIALLFHIASAALGDSGSAHTRTSGDLSIILNGANPLQEECGEPFSDPGAIASNSAGKVIPVRVSGQVDWHTPGTYTLTYLAADDRDSTSIERTVNIVDTTPPEIALEGGKTMTVSCADTFTEPGASASDSCQGPVPVTIAGSVNSSVPGTYEISYTATDAYNNTRTVTRSVIVGSIEDNPPTITLYGDVEMTVECGGNFTDPGATANTPCSGSVLVATSGSVDVYAPGNYNLIYSAANNELSADAPRVVSIVDTRAPLISLKGSSPMTLVRGSPFVDPGATAYDGCAGEFAATASGIVDHNRIGSYTITYTASDPSGNQATPLSRTVNVIDPPPTAAIHSRRWLIVASYLKARPALLVAP